MAEATFNVTLDHLLRLIQHAHDASDMHRNDYSDFKKSNQADADAVAAEEILEQAGAVTHG